MFDKQGGWETGCGVQTSAWARVTLYTLNTELLTLAANYTRRPREGSGGSRRRRASPGLMRLVGPALSFRFREFLDRKLDLQQIKFNYRRDE